MAKSQAKRFYKTVSTAAHNGEAAGFTVLLDGRVLKTPSKMTLITGLEAHAELIAREWEAQEGEIKPHTMPVTRVYNVALERTPENREAITAELRKYAGTDLLCYRAGEPAELRRAQDSAWDEWLDWARGKGIDLRSVTGVMATPQDEAALDKVSALASDFADLELTLLGHFNAVYGSAVLALAVMTGDLDAQAGWDISRIDAQFQIDRWGEDQDAAEVAAATRAEVIALSKLI